MFHPVDLQLQVPSSGRSQTIVLPSTRCVILGEAFDPTLVQQPSQRPVKSSGTEHHPPAAHLFHVLEDRVSMTRLLAQAEQDQQHRLTAWQRFHIPPADMSSDAILPRPDARVHLFPFPGPKWHVLNFPSYPAVQRNRHLLIT